MRSCTQNPQAGASIKFWLAVICCTCACVGLIESSRILPLLLPTSISSSGTSTIDKATTEIKTKRSPKRVGGSGDTDNIATFVEPIGYLGSDNDDDGIDRPDDEVDNDAVDDDINAGIDELVWETVEGNETGDCTHLQDGTTYCDIPPTKPINYGLEPDKFVNELLECFRDRNCRILYFHFRKTGGKDVEYRMSLYMPPHSAKACCDDVVMKRFLSDPNSYCGGLHKFASFEVLSKPFLDTVVPTCLSLPLAPRPKNLGNRTKTAKTTSGKKARSRRKAPAPAPAPPKRPTKDRSMEVENDRRTLGGTDTELRVISGNMKYTAKSRAIILASFREPHQRTLSYIHQTCNKLFKKRPKEVQRACQRCDYHNDSAFWNQFASEYTNDQYQDFSNLLSSQIPNTQVLYVDLADFSGLISDMYNVTKQHRAFDPKMAPRNPETLDVCNFSFESGLFKVLRPSTELYRQWTLGNV
jgi:hypothetical protein